MFLLKQSNKMSWTLTVFFEILDHSLITTFPFMVSGNPFSLTKSWFRFSSDNGLNKLIFQKDRKNLSIRQSNYSDIHLFIPLFNFELLLLVRTIYNDKELKAEECRIDIEYLFVMFFVKCAIKHFRTEDILK